MSLKQQISNLCFQRFNLTPSPTDSRWSDIKAIACQFGPDYCAELFEEWGRQYKGYNNYPLASFLRFIYQCPRDKEGKPFVPKSAKQLGPCPDCGKNLYERSGKFGPFVGCSGFPECKYTRRIDATGYVPQGVSNGL